MRLEIDLGNSAVEVFLRPAIIALESFAELLKHNRVQGRIGVSCNKSSISSFPIVDLCTNVCGM